MRRAFGTAALRWTRLFAVALTLALLGPASVIGSEARYFQFATTQSYMAASLDLRTGYVAGLVDAFLAFNLVPKSTRDCIAVMRLQEIRAGFDHWLQNRPIEWRYSLPSNFSSAMHNLCD